MNALALFALVEPGASDSALVTLRSPSVGILRGAPSPGHRLAGGEPFARLSILGRMHALLLPEDLAGAVAELLVPGYGRDSIPVEYAQPILTLDLSTSASRGRFPSDPAAPGARRGRKTSASSLAAAAPLPAGCHAVLSPADGVFYRRPRPADAAYVEVKSRVRHGQTLALLEAMKCFSAITYGGPGHPEEAEVVEIRAEDAAEVKHGQVLFVVK
jgi:biotin carboxyl carrier protein